jgi:hypothetical protein
MANPAIELNDVNLEFHGLQSIRVDLGNLRPGVRYSFTASNENGLRFEGTFTRVVPAANGNPAQYLFSDIFAYTEPGKKLYKSQQGNFRSPQNIFVVASNELPGDLNQYINKFGGKSRKSNRTRKSKRRRNRKSKKRR